MTDVGYRAQGISEVDMQTHPHFHLALPHIRPWRLGRGAAIGTAAALALAAAFAAVGYDNDATLRRAVAATTASAAALSTPLSVEVRQVDTGVVATIRGLDTEATNSISIYGDDGVVRSGALVDHGVTRFENMPTGEYHIEISSEGPVEFVNDALISAAVLVRSEQFSLAAPGLISVEPR
jgi:hypothetical protein